MPGQRISAATVAALLVLVACDEQTAKTAQTPSAPPPPPAVTVITAAAGPVMLKDRLPGRVVAYRRAEVRPQVGGLIERRLFEEGATVEAGQQLYRIDPESYQASLNVARADQAKAQATSVQADKKLERYQELLKTQAASRQAYDDAVAAAAEARAAVTAAKAKADVAAINVAYTKVTAPISGVIGRSSVSEGALVTASQATPLATITQLDPIYVDLTQSSTKLIEVRRKIADGELQGADDVPVTLLLDGSGDAYARPGKLQFSEVFVDESTGSVSLRAVFPNPDKVLLPGMFVRAEVTQGRMERGFLIPQKAVMRAPDGDAFVWIVGEGDRVTRRSVTLGRTVDGDWLVMAGLKDGDRVIVEGTGKVKDGAVVTPQPVGTSPAPAQPRG